MCLKDCLYCLMMPLKILVWIRSATKTAINKVHPVVEENFDATQRETRQPDNERVSRQPDNQRVSFQPDEYTQDRVSISSEDTYIDGLWNYPEYYTYNSYNNNNFNVPIWLLQQQARNVNGKLRTSAAAASDTFVSSDLWTSHYSYPAMDFGYFGGVDPDSPEMEKSRKYSFYDNMYSYYDDYSPTEPTEIFHQISSRPSSQSSGSSSASSGSEPPASYESTAEYFPNLGKETLNRLYFNHSTARNQSETEIQTASSQGDAFKNTEPNCGTLSPVSVDIASELKKRSNSLQVPNGIELSPKVDETGMEIMSCEYLRSRGRSLSECSYTDRVVLEILDTERKYVRDLRDIVEGYIQHVSSSSSLLMSRVEFEALFGNLSEIYSFNRNFLQSLESCNGDAVRIARCFTLQKEGFSIYSTYCTNYPRAVEVLIRSSRNEKTSAELKLIQKGLGHPLPLGSYLLKPVQRILKYHLLLQKILEHHDESSLGHSDISQAVEFMTGVARHIDTMKRRHESSVRTQEIRSLMLDWRGPDLVTLGNLILEDKFRVYGAKALRLIFLFNKALIIAKQREDGALLVKSFIMCSNLMLMEIIPKQPLNFQIVPFDSPKIQYTIQAKNVEQKNKWCQEIKRLMLDSYDATIPDKAKELVMRLGNSRREERPKSSKDFLDPNRIQPAAPEYLDRWRGRRKSAGAIQDLKLKTKKENPELRSNGNSPTSPKTWRRKSEGSEFRNLVNDLRKKSLSQTLTVTTTMQVLQKSCDNDSIKQDNGSTTNEHNGNNTCLLQQNTSSNMQMANNNNDTVKHHSLPNTGRHLSPHFKVTSINSIPSCNISQNQTPTLPNTTKADLSCHINNTGSTIDCQRSYPLNTSTEHPIDPGELTRKDSVAIRKAKLGVGNGHNQKKQTVTFEKCDLNMNKPLHNSTSNSFNECSNLTKNDSQSSSQSSHSKYSISLSDNQEEPIPFFKIDFALPQNLESKQMPTLTQADDVNEGDFGQSLTTSHTLKTRRRSYECSPRSHRSTKFKDMDETLSTPGNLVGGLEVHENVRSRSAGNSPCLALNRIRIRQGNDVGVQTCVDISNSTGELRQYPKVEIQSPSVDHMALKLLANDSLVETEIVSVENDYKYSKEDICGFAAQPFYTNDLTTSSRCGSEMEDKELNESFSRFKSAVLNSNLFSTDELNDICQTLKCDDLVDLAELESSDSFTVIDNNTCSNEKKEKKKTDSKQNDPRSRLRLKIPKCSPTEGTRSKSTDRITNAFRNTLNHVASKFSKRRLLLCSTTTGHHSTSGTTPTTAPAEVGIGIIVEPELSTCDGSVDQLALAANSAENGRGQKQLDSGAKVDSTSIQPTHSNIHVLLRALGETDSPVLGERTAQSAPVALDVTLCEAPQPPPRRSRVGSNDKRAQLFPSTVAPNSIKKIPFKNENTGLIQVQGIRHGMEFKKRSRSVGDIHVFKQQNRDQLNESSANQRCDLTSVHSIQSPSLQESSREKVRNWNGKVISEKVKPSSALKTSWLKSCQMFEQQCGHLSTKAVNVQIAERTKNVGDMLRRLDPARSCDFLWRSSLSLDDNALDYSNYSSSAISDSHARKNPRSGSPMLVNFHQYGFDSFKTYVG